MATQYTLTGSFTAITEEKGTIQNVGNNGNGANGTGYIRGADSNPTDAPAYVPTTEEKRQALIAQYESDKTELQKQLVEAILYNDTSLQDEIKADMIAVDSQFDADIKELEG